LGLNGLENEFGAQSPSAYSSSVFDLLEVLSGIKVSEVIWFRVCSELISRRRKPYIMGFAL
jgi:hypothetical protein